MDKNKPVTQKQRDYANALVWMNDFKIPKFEGKTYGEFIEYCEKYEDTADRKKAKMGVY